MKKKVIPKFKTENEEAKYWVKNSLIDHMDEVEEIDAPFKFDPKVLGEVAGEGKRKEEKRMIALRIEPSNIDLAKIIAKKRGSAYQSLMRFWIKAKIQEELKNHPEIVQELRKRELQRS